MPAMNAITCDFDSFDTRKSRGMKKREALLKEKAAQKLKREQKAAAKGLRVKSTVQNVKKNTVDYTRVLPRHDSLQTDSVMNENRLDARAVAQFALSSAPSAETIEAVTCSAEARAERGNASKAAKKAMSEMRENESMQRIEDDFEMIGDCKRCQGWELVM